MAPSCSLMPLQLQQYLLLLHLRAGDALRGPTISQACLLAACPCGYPSNMHGISGCCFKYEAQAVMTPAGSPIWHW